MNPPNPSIWSPSAAVLQDLHEQAQDLIRCTANVTERAILHGRTRSPNKHIDEVATLAWFFVHGLPELQTLWNRHLTVSSVEMKGVFCHRSGKLGPIVGFGNPQRRCELSDLLLIVTGGGSKAKEVFGNAMFLQAKSARWPLSGVSTENQRHLFEEASEFTFQDTGSIATTSLSENNPPGRRLMPAGRERGFKFWFYERAKFYRFNRLHWHSDPYWRMASTTAEPHRLSYPEFDVWFPMTMFELLTGRDGLGLEPLTPADFGWNRMVRDVVACSIDKALAVGHKLDTSATRAMGWSALDLAVLFNDTAAGLANPRQNLGAMFGDGELARGMTKLSATSRTPPEKLKRKDPGEGPPDWTEDVGDGENGGGASFIWINLTERVDRK